MVSWINSDLTYIEVNQQLADIFNRPRTDFVGKDIGFIDKSSEFNTLIKEFLQVISRK